MVITKIVKMKIVEKCGDGSMIGNLVLMKIIIKKIKIIMRMVWVIKIMVKNSGYESDNESGDRDDDNGR